MKHYDPNKEYDRRHGSPFDRGSVDSYYYSSRDPHYYTPIGAGMVHGTRVEREDMTEAQIEEYYAGYEYNEEVCMDHKEWT
jgi:hypothetical protein